MALNSLIQTLKGGANSGNHIPGHVGGSTPKAGPGGKLLLPKGTYPERLVRADAVKDGMYLVMFSSSHQSLAPIKDVKITPKVVRFTYTLDDGKSWQKDYSIRFNREAEVPVVQL